MSSLHIALVSAFSALAVLVFWDQRKSSKILKRARMDAEMFKARANTLADRNAGLRARIEILQGDLGRGRDQLAREFKRREDLEAKLADAGAALAKKKPAQVIAKLERRITELEAELSDTQHRERVFRSGETVAGDNLKPFPGAK